MHDYLTDDLNEIPSSPGSVTQVRECTSYLMNLAKATGVAIIIIGHVTKSGEIAGPRVLEHLVDTVLYFEGEKQQNLRLLRSMKNRFGPTDEIAVFQMGEIGLSEITNPSKLFIEDRAKGTTGSVITPMIEGTRPILIEAQALVTDTFYPTPSRRSAGLDPNRLALLLAVCEKRACFKLHQSDVFVSVKEYGSLEKCIEVLTSISVAVQGSGWGWLGYCEKGGHLHITSSQNHKSPHGLKPLLCIDVWEHAYYLQYKNNRGDFVKNIWSVINWKTAEERFLAAKK